MLNKANGVVLYQSEPTCAEPLMSDPAYPERFSKAVNPVGNRKNLFRLSRQQHCWHWLLFAASFPRQLASRISACSIGGS